MATDEWSNGNNNSRNRISSSSINDTNRKIPTVTVSVGPYKNEIITRPTYINDIKNSNDRKTAIGVFSCILGYGREFKKKPRIIEVHGKSKNHSTWLLAAFGMLSVDNHCFNWLKNKIHNKVVSKIYYDSTLHSRSKNQYNEHLCGALIVQIKNNDDNNDHFVNNNVRKSKAFKNIITTSEHADYLDSSTKYNPRNSLRIKQPRNKKHTMRNKNRNRRNMRKAKKNKEPEKKGFFVSLIDFALGTSDK